MKNVFKIFLGSSHSQIRLITAHVLSFFSNLSIIADSIDDPKTKHALDLPYLAEIEPATVQNYRSRLIHIQALDFHGAAVSRLNPVYHDYPLHYLLGNLFINFSLLWDPVCKVISSYGSKECFKFWEVFLEKLKNEVEKSTGNIPEFQTQILNDMINKVHGKREKVDYVNYKLLLWKIMGMIVGYCEVKNRDYVGLVIDFVENFFKQNSEYAKSCNIKKRDSSTGGK